MPRLRSEYVSCKFPPNRANHILAGHQARDCPTKPKICKICREEGHEALACTGKMKLNLSHVADKSVDEAWALLIQASDERDLDDFKDAVKMLSKADPNITYVDMEKEFRTREFKVYLIGLEKESGPTFTNVDLQGNTGKKYAIGYFFSEKPQRPTMVDKWPESPEANLERLADVGIPMDRGVPVCNNWYVSMSVQQHLLTTSATSWVMLSVIARKTLWRSSSLRSLVPSVAKMVIVFATAPRSVLSLVVREPARSASRRSTSPRSAPTARSVPATSVVPKITCPEIAMSSSAPTGTSSPLFFCILLTIFSDAEGHVWRDCTAPKDWSRVTCRNCGEKGHTIKRCKQPIKEQENTNPSGDGDGGFGDAADSGAGAGGGGWDDKPAADSGAGGDWETQAAPVAVSGGGGW
jgi:hypothetical protein